MFKKQPKKFEFTDYNVKKINCPRDVSMLVFKDTVKPHLALVAYRDTNNIMFAHMFKNKLKMIGMIDEMSVEEARKITKNIDENYEEFSLTLIPHKTSIKDDIKVNGFFPRNGVFKGTETVLSDENASLKEKIKELNNEIDELKKSIKPLKMENLELREILQTINNSRHEYLNSLKKLDYILAEE